MESGCLLYGGTTGKQQQQQNYIDKATVDRRFIIYLFLSSDHTGLIYPMT